jgi:hypothetical protein
MRKYIGDELTCGSLSLLKQREFLELQREVITFFKVPYKLEKLLFFGFWICFDAFLYYFTSVMNKIPTGKDQHRSDDVLRG